jgi:hypothetical protein
MRKVKKINSLVKYRIRKKITSTLTKEFEKHATILFSHVGFLDLLLYGQTANSSNGLIERAER